MASTGLSTGRFRAGLISVAAMLAAASPSWAQQAPGSDYFYSNGGGNPYGGPHPSRPTGRQANRDDSVYCQQDRNGNEISKPYGRTYANTPCGPNFVRQPPAAAPQSDCQPSVSPRSRARAQAGAQEALRTFAQMGQQADIMLTTLGKLAVARVVHLADRNTTLEQLQGAAQAAVTYVTNKDGRAQTQKQLFAQASNAVDYARRNPAATVGVIGEAMLEGRVLQPPRFLQCTAPLKSAAALEQELAQAEAAEQELVAIAKAQQKRPPPTPGASACPVNPGGGKLNCTYASIAYDMRRKTGFAWVADHFNWRQADQNPESWARLNTTLRELYGDQLYEGLTADRARAQLEGRMSEMRRFQMEDELRAAAGSNPRGLVVVDWGNGSSHMFNVEYSKAGGFKYFDPQADADGIGNLWKAGAAAGKSLGMENILFYRTN